MITISSKAIKRQRIHIKYMFIIQYSGKYTYNIGILDDNYNFYDKQIILTVDSITPCCYKTLNKFFNDFLITKESEINFLDNIQKTSPLYLYLSIINQHVFANIRFVNLDLIPRRIAAYHHSYLGSHKKSSNISKNMIERLWTKLVQMEKCPWISKDINISLNQQSKISRKKQMYIRLGLYYCVVKRFFVNAAIESRNKNNNCI